MTNTPNPLDYVEMAKTLTESKDIDVILDTARKLASYASEFTTPSGVEWVPPTFGDFIKYVSTSHPIRGVVQYTPYPFQRDFAVDLHWKDYIVHCCSRMIGTTLTLSAFALWFALSSRKQNVIFVNARQASGFEVFDRMKIIADHLPFTFCAGSAKRTAYEMVFTNGSKISFKTYSNLTPEHTDSADLLILNDAALCSHSFSARIKECIKTSRENGCKVIVSSTPSQPNNNRPEGLFWDLWNAATPNERVHHPWHVIADRSAEWASHYKKAIGKDAFEAEYEAKFTQPM